MKLAPACLAFALVVGAKGDEPFQAWLDHVYQPWHAESVALSPDGRHLACVLLGDAGASLAIVDVDDPDKKPVMSIGEGKLWTHWWEGSQRASHAAFLGWVAADRLVVASDNAVFSVGADGSGVRTLASADSLPGEPAIAGAKPNARYPRVLGVCADDPRHVVIEARGHPYEIFTCDIDTGALASVYKDETPGAAAYCDRQGRPRIKIERENHGSEERTLVATAPGNAAFRDIDSVLRGAGAAKFRFTADTYYGDRSIPIGFDFDPNVLYYASNGGRDTYALFAADLSTGKRTALEVDDAGFDLVDPGSPAWGTRLVFDNARRKLVGVRLRGLEPSTRWLDPELALAQALLEERMPGRTVEILGWSDDRNRYLVLASSDAEPGRYYVYFRDADRLVEFLRRAPWFDLDKVNPSAAFAFDAPSGAHVTGRFVSPSDSGAKPEPLVVFCPDEPAGSFDAGFDRDAQALAGMGFAVAEVNPRGCSGFGEAYRDAARPAAGTLPVEDVCAAVTWLEKQHPIDAGRIAILGRGFGGTLALRALQLDPGMFRCAVAISAPTDLREWLASSSRASDRPSAAKKGGKGGGGMGSIGESDGGGGGGKKGGGGNGFNAPAPAPDPFALQLRRWFLDKVRSKLNDISPARHPESITKPVCLVQERDSRVVPLEQATLLRDALTAAGRPPTTIDTSIAFSRGDPATRAQVFGKIRDFLEQSMP